MQVFVESTEGAQEKVDAHDIDEAAHADIRALIGEGGGGAVSSVNTRIGAVIGLAEQSALDALATTVGNKADASATTSALATKTAKSANLSDLASAGTARTNLGLGGSATLNVGATAGTVAAGDDVRFTSSVVTVPADKTSDYTLVLGDAGSSIGCNAATLVTVTIPPNSAVAFPVGTTLELRQVGVGRAAFAAGAGVSLRAADGYVTTRVQYSAVSALKVTTDTWSISGDVAP